MNRRERFRDLTREEIKQHARQQMMEGGTASLSLGGIARAMDLTPSALYRYYASRDDLVTGLIVDAYNALADALVSAADIYPADEFARRLLATSLMYRTWAIEHPIDFLLIFGNPIPGYQVSDAATEQAAHRVFAAFLGTMQAAADAGMLNPVAEHIRLGPELSLETSEDSHGHRVQPQVSLSGTAAWTKIHGMVMLELVGHLSHAVSDPARFYHTECLRVLAEFGFNSFDSA